MADIDLDRNLHAEQFDSKYNMRSHCTREQCNFIVPDIQRVNEMMRRASARGHLMVVHGFSRMQIAMEDTRAGKFFRAIMAR